MRKEWSVCMKDIDNVKQARESFNRIIDNKKYSDIIKDDKHLAVIMKLIEDSNYNKNRAERNAEYNKYGKLA